MRTVFMFSGMGSQYYQMGRDLYESNERFKLHLEKQNNLIYEHIGKSVIDYIFEPGKDIDQPLEMTLIPGLSIYMLQMAVVKTLNDFDIYADLYLGVSYGTIVASIAAGCIGENDAIALLVNQSQIFSRICIKGKMAMVLAPITTYNTNRALKSISEIAGINFDNSYVITFPASRTEEIDYLLKKHELTYQLLPVARAYHSFWIDNAKDQILNLYNQIAFKPATVPLICSSNDLIVKHEVNSDFYWQAIRGVMQIKRTIKFLEEKNNFQYIDVGPMGSMAAILKYIIPSDSKSTTFPIISPYKRSEKNLSHLKKNCKFSEQVLPA